MQTLLLEPECHTAYECGWEMSPSANVNVNGDECVNVRLPRLLSAT